MKEEVESEKGRESKFIRESKEGKGIYHRKGRAVTMSLILLFTTFVSLTAFFPAVQAQTQIPTYYGWNGYEGNQSIYLTTYIPSTNPYLIPANTTSSIAVQPSGNGNVKNVIDVSVGGYTHTTNGNTLAYAEYYYGGLTNQMVIDIPVTAAGSSNWTETTTASNQGGGSTTILNGIDYEQLSMNVSSRYPSALTSFETAYDAGINVSSTYDEPTNLTQVGWNTMWYLLGLVPDGIGQVVSTYQYENSLYGTAGLASNPSDQFVGPGNDTQMKFGMDVGATQTGSYIGSYSENWGYDTYGVTTVYQLTIMSKDFLNASNINIGAQNIEQTNSNGIVTTSNGAYSNVSINVAPAYTIQGTAYLNGAPAANTELLLETPSANYYIWTDSNGQYRFFAQPGVNYFLTSPTTNIGGVQIFTTSSDVGGGTYNLSLTTQTFSESGLSGGASWSVKISGPLLPSGNQEFYTTPSTSSSSIGISVAGNESYLYSVNAPSGYTANPSSGSFNVGTTTPSTISVSFTKTPTYSVTFKESGLPSGTLWSAKLDGAQESSTSSTITFSSVTAGSHSYSIPYVYYSTTLWYEPYPGSGTFSMSGPYTVDTTFTGVPQNPNSCVYAFAPVLLSNYSVQYAQNIKIGDNIMTYNFTTGSMQQGTVQQVFTTQHSEMYVINGYLKVAGDQVIWTNHGYVQAQNLTSNDKIFDVFNHHFYRVHSISVEYGDFTMYDFYVTANHNYVVWSNLMKDRLP